MAVIVTGTPGTGKTTVAKNLAEELGFDYIDVNQIIDNYKLSEGFDEKRDSRIIDTDKLNEKLIQLIKENPKVVIDSHLSHFLPGRYVDLCIVTKCELKELERRLKDRGYPQEKVKENMDCEIFDICLNEAREAGHKIKIIWTSLKHFD